MQWLRWGPFWYCSGMKSVAKVVARAGHRQRFSGVSFSSGETYQHKLPASREGATRALFSSLYTRQILKQGATQLQVGSTSCAAVNWSGFCLQSEQAVRKSHHREGSQRKEFLSAGSFLEDSGKQGRTERGYTECQSMGAGLAEVAETAEWSGPQAGTNMQSSGEAAGEMPPLGDSGDEAGEAKPGRQKYRERIDIDRVYEELGLGKVSAQVGGLGRKVRHHVNPLRVEYQVQTPPPVWSEVFADPLLPLHVDVGCAQGRFLLTLAKRSQGAHNFLGLEIRQQLVERGNKWGAALGLKNTHFLLANATISLDSVLSTYPGPLTYVTILCPDPHFKNRLRNRRVVQPSLVEAIVKRLVPGGKAFIQSDVLEVAKDMKHQLEATGGPWLDLADEHACEDKCTAGGWLRESPLGVPTERETFAVLNGESIYRAVFVRNNNEFFCETLAASKPDLEAEGGDPKDKMNQGFASLFE